MFIVTARLPKRRLLTAGLTALCCCVAVIAGIFCLQSLDSVSAASEVKGIRDNDDRIAYLESMGWQVEEEPVETLQFLLPEKLEEPYLTYNELQDTQGFDLSVCCGKQVARYTYTVTNYPGRAEGVQANLYVCEGQPVAGDILCAGADGFQDTLVYPGEAN